MKGSVTGSGEVDYEWTIGEGLIARRGLEGPPVNAMRVAPRVVRVSVGADLLKAAAVTGVPNGMGALGKTAAVIEGVPQSPQGEGLPHWYMRLLREVLRSDDWLWRVPMPAGDECVAAVMRREVFAWGEATEIVRDLEAAHHAEGSLQNVFLKTRLRELHQAEILMPLRDKAGERWGLDIIKRGCWIMCDKEWLAEELRMWREKPLLVMLSELTTALDQKHRDRGEITSGAEYDRIHAWMAKAHDDRFTGIYYESVARLGARGAEAQRLRNGSVEQLTLAFLAELPSEEGESSLDLCIRLYTEALAQQGTHLARIFACARPPGKLVEAVKLLTGGCGFIEDARVMGGASHDIVVNGDTLGNPLSEQGRRAVSFAAQQAGVWGLAEQHRAAATWSGSVVLSPAERRRAAATWYGNVQVDGYGTLAPSGDASSSVGAVSDARKRRPRVAVGPGGTVLGDVREA